MARLNEPPMATDGIELLKRKFLRQNREIARINSHQSQRIRELENDCARMLSENLELRSVILRLEHDIERNSSQRIADHALEVRAKLQEQLDIFSELLGGLGTEPPRKRHAPDGRRLTKAKSGSTLFSPARRLRNVAQDTESLALQEGRLPPIPENRSYPRATLNGDEIRALLSETADTTDSPDLGPPPISQFIDIDPVKVDSPSSKSLAEQLDVILPSPVEPPELSTPTLPRLTFDKPIPTLRRQKEPTIVPFREESLAELQAADSRTQASKPGSKRKFGDENELLAGNAVNQVAEGEQNQSMAHQETQKQRVIKDIPLSRREKPALGPARKALAAKSTNDSPRKIDKLAKGKSGKPMEQGTDRSTSRPHLKSLDATIEIPPPATREPSPALAELELPDLDTPLTPGHTASRAVATPPPAAVDANGEAIRPSRRARAAVSYAEPNLRDKMRRPTKELFDAVSGEGKFRHRTSINIKEEAKDDKGPLSASKSVSKPITIKEEQADQPLLCLLPINTQESTSEPDATEALPIATVTQRKRRGSSMAFRESSGPTAAVPGQPLSETNESDSLHAEDLQSSDPYDFSTSTLASPDKTTENIAPKPANARSRKSRASSASFQGNNSGQASDKAKDTARKRASMVAPRTRATPATETDDGEETSIDAEPLPERLSRRRSMML